MAENLIQPGDILLLHALADGELDTVSAMALEQRLAAEPALEAEFQSIVALKEKVASLGRPAISPDFHERMAALGAGASASTRPPAANRLARGWQGWQGWQNIAAAVLVTALVASGATYLLAPGRSGMSMEDIVAASHRRSLLAASPVDIVSSDRHTVKPWLDAKLGISPPATDLAAQGYPLLGGRVDVVGADAVPTLVYRHNEHLITLMAAPGTKAITPPASETAGGYNIVHWSEGGFSFWAISDLEAAELMTFVADYRG